MTHERRFRLFLVAFWIAPALIGTLGFRLVPSQLNPDMPLGLLLLSQLAMWGLWSLWSMLFWTVGNRIPFVRGNMRRAIAIHLPLGLVVLFTQILVQAELSVLFGFSPRRGLESTVVLGVRSYGDVFVVLLCAIVGAQVAFRWYANWQAQRVIAARIGQDLAQAQLRALQAQLNPHFLFNALNSVVTLIGRDPVLAQRTVVRLADLLRATLRAGSAQLIPLSQELELTRRYLDIEQVRFADRLAVHWDTDHATDTGAPDIMVPAFALQPLVENALVHGVGKLSGPGVVRISARRAGAGAGAGLVLRVSDNGPGPLAASHSGGTGVGLSNLRARLERLYAGEASLTLHAADDGGTDVELTLPLSASVPQALEESRMPVQASSGTD